MNSKASMTIVSTINNKTVLEATDYASKIEAQRAMIEMARLQAPVIFSKIPDQVDFAAAQRGQQYIERCLRQFDNRKSTFDSDYLSEKVADVVGWKVTFS